jgi:hypothetical protein
MIDMIKLEITTTIRTAPPKTFEFCYTIPPPRLILHMDADWLLQSTDKHPCAISGDCILVTGFGCPSGQTFPYTDNSGGFPFPRQHFNPQFRFARY